MTIIRIKLTLWARCAVFFLQFSTKTGLGNKFDYGAWSAREDCWGQTYGRPPESVFHQDDAPFTRRVTDGHKRQTGGLLTAVIGKWEAFKFSSCPALRISDITVKNIINKWKLCGSVGTNQLLLLCNLTAHPIDFKYRGNRYKNDCKAAELESWEWKLLLLFSPNRFLITANIQCFSSTVNGLFFPLPHQPALYKTKTNLKKCKYKRVTKAASVWIFRLWGINNIAIIGNYFPALKERKSKCCELSKEQKRQWHLVQCAKVASAAQQEYNCRSFTSTEVNKTEGLCPAEWWFPLIFDSQMYRSI